MLALQQPSRVATASHFADPNWMARFNLSLRRTPLRCPLPPQFSNLTKVSNFATPQGWRGQICVCVGCHYAAPPPPPATSGPRKWRHDHTSQPPPGMPMSNLSLRRTSLRWPSQQPLKVATASHFAAPPRDGEVQSESVYDVTMLAPQQPSTIATVSHVAATQLDGEV